MNTLSCRLSFLSTYSSQRRKIFQDVSKILGLQFNSLLRQSTEPGFQHQLAGLTQCLSPLLAGREPSGFGNKYHLYYLTGISISSSRLLSSMWTTTSRTAIMAYLARVICNLPNHYTSATVHLVGSKETCYYATSKAHSPLQILKVGLKLN